MTASPLRDESDYGACSHHRVVDCPDGYRRCKGCGLVLQLPIDVLENE